MGALDREAIYAAVLTRLQTIPGVTFSRRLPPGEPPVPAEQPCAFVPCDKETPQRAAAVPLKWILSTIVTVYARTDDTSQAPSSVLTPIVKAFEAALTWQAGDKAWFGMGSGAPTNLGGLCEYCTIGEVLYGEGIDSGQGVAFIPITILAVSTP